MTWQNPHLRVGGVAAPLPVSRRGLLTNGGPARATFPTPGPPTAGQLPTSRRIGPGRTPYRCNVGFSCSPQTGILFFPARWFRRGRVAVGVYLKSPWESVAILILPAGAGLTCIPEPELRLGTAAPLPAAFIWRGRGIARLGRPGRCSSRRAERGVGGPYGRSGCASPCCAWCLHCSTCSSLVSYPQVWRLHACE